MIKRINLLEMHRTLETFVPAVMFEWMSLM
jgi:hypothetical protein